MTPYANQVRASVKALAAASCAFLALYFVNPAYGQTYGLGTTNFIVDPVQLAASVNFTRTRFRSGDCAVVEGTLGNSVSGFPSPFPKSGIRRDLMRFDLLILNYSDTDFSLGTPDESLPYWEFSSCHGHYHLVAFAQYELLDASGETVLDRRDDPIFCVSDSFKWDLSAGPGLYDCGSQGISAGWGSLLSSTLTGKWLDVTGYPPGNYKLRVTVDHENQFVEADETDNSTVIDVVIPSRIK